MATVNLSAPGISCGHCEGTITRALGPVEGIRRVAVSIPQQQVRVDYDPKLVDIERMKAILEAADYPVAAVVPQAADESLPAEQADATGCACCRPRTRPRPSTLGS
jgi:copper chaperone